MAEQFRRDQGLRNRRAIHADEGPRRSFRLGVNGASDQLLPGAGLAGDEHRRIGRRHLGDLRQDSPQRAGRADDLLEHRRPGDLLAQGEVLLANAVLRLHALVDVGAGDIPADHASPPVAEGIVADEEPTIRAVVPAQPDLELERNARGQRLLPLAVQALHVVRVHDPLAKAEGAQVFQAQAGVVDEHPIRVQHLAVEADHRDGLVDGVRDPAHLRFRFPQGLQGSLPADRDLHSLPRAVDQLDLGLGRHSRLGGVERECPQHLAFLGENGLGPRRPDPVPEGEIAILVGPDGIGRDVGDDDPLLEVGRGTAATFARSDRPWADRREPPGRNAGTRGMPQLRSLGVHQQDRRVDGGSAVSVDGAAEVVQRVREARAVRDHLEGPLLRGAQRLRLLSIVDVGGSPVPLDDLAGLVADRFDAEEEPAIGAVRAAQPCLALAGLALGEDRLPFRGQPLEVVGMHRRLPSPAEAFPGGETRVVLPPPIQESGGAARPGAPGKRRNRVDELVPGIHGPTAKLTVSLTGAEGLCYRAAASALS